jgi:hypothetical protein
MNFTDALKMVLYNERFAVCRESHPKDQQAWAYSVSDPDDFACSDRPERVSTVVAQKSKAHSTQTLFEVFNVEDILENDWIVAERRSE